MKYAVLTFILLLFFYHSYAQYLNVMINNEAQPNEPTITLDPRHPNRLVAGSNLRSYYVSDDGGYSWISGTLVSPEYGVLGDPAVIVDTAGTFYYFHLSAPESGNYLDRIVCQRYDFESGTWDDGTYMGLNGTKEQDKEWATVDSATNTIYVTWTQFDGPPDPSNYSNIMFSKSTDGGDTWSDAIRINEISGDCYDSDSTVEGAVPAVGPDGEVYVAWSGPEGIVFDRSLDGGETWLNEDIFISDQPGGWSYDIPGLSRCNGLPVTCCDLSNSPYRGNIYVNWTDQRNGIDDTDVWIAKSTDGGDTWSEPIRVNDDPTGKQQFLSWMTIDGTNGNIYVIFYDRRNYEDWHTDVYVAMSTDGGETFENILISDSSFYSSSVIFLGDYSNIVAYDNQIRPIWIRTDNGIRSIWTAIMDLTVGNMEIVKKNASLTLDQNYPNPFRETTRFSYKLSDQTVVTLAVYDVYGKPVAILKDQDTEQKGEYTEMFDPEQYGLSPGIYYYILRTQNQMQKRQMIFVK